MKNQAKDSLENATERPWRYTRNDVKKEYGVHHDNVFIRSGEKVVCEVWEENEANAALIVRCCNNYDSMLSLLKSINERGFTNDNKARLREVLEANKD